MIEDKNGQFKNVEYSDAIYNSNNFFQLFIDFVIRQGRKTFTCQSMKQEASLTLGKALEKTEKRATDGVLLTPLYAKKTYLPQNIILENSLDPEVT